MAYTKRLSITNGWLRRMDAVDSTGAIIPTEPAPFMRVRGLVQEGWEESTETGSDFVRLIGDFAAEAVQRDGGVAHFESKNLVFPAIVEGVISQLTSDTKSTTLSGRTGGHYSTPDMQVVEFVADVYLEAPATAGVKGGYVFSVKFPVKPHCVSPLAKVGAHLPPFVPPEAEAKPAEAEAKKAKKTA